MERALRGLDRKARARFFENRAAEDEEEKGQKDAGPQLEAHIGRVLTLIQSKWPPSTRAIEYALTLTLTLLPDVHRTCADCWLACVRACSGASVYTGAAGVALLYLHLHHLNTPATAQGA
jgi:hypothetical protein